jgi:hypothetical protein
MREVCPPAIVVCAPGGHLFHVVARREGGPMRGNDDRGNVRRSRRFVDCGLKRRDQGLRQRVALPGPIEGQQEDTSSHFFEKKAVHDLGSDWL